MKNGKMKNDKNEELKKKMERKKQKKKKTNDYSHPTALANDIMQSSIHNRNNFTGIRVAERYYFM